jgi:hypothetical protein
MITVGSIVQVNPQAEGPAAFYRGCLVVVTEVRVWGIIGMIQMTGPEYGVIWLRLS